jgi:hypothetical protein
MRIHRVDPLAVRPKSSPDLTAARREHHCPLIVDNDMIVRDARLSASTAIPHPASVSSSDLTETDCLEVV